MWGKSNCSVICQLFKITFLGKWDERGECPFLCPLTSFPDRHTHSVHSVQYCLSSCFQQFCWGFATCCFFIFYEHLTFPDQITALSKACYYHIRHRSIRAYLDSSTASAIAISIVHSRLDYCNSLYYKLPKSQLSRLEQIQNSLARTVMKAPKSCHITPILRSLHWLRITERIEYKLLSLTYKVLTTTPVSYTHLTLPTIYSV